MPTVRSPSRSLSATIALLSLAACGVPPEQSAPGPDTPIDHVSAEARARRVARPPVNVNPTPVDVWDFCDRGWFEGRGYSYPFHPGEYDGVNLAMNAFTCEGEYRRDWELYNFNLSPRHLSQGGHSGGHHFTLYNRPLGLLRTFVFVEAGKAQDGQKHSVSLDVLADGARTVEHAYLNYAGPGPAFTLPESRTANQTPPSSFVASSQRQKWLVTDTYLSYDARDFAATSPNTSFTFQYLGRTHNRSDFKMNGRIDPIAQGMAMNPRIDMFTAGRIIADAAKGGYKGYKLDDEDIGATLGDIAGYAEKIGLKSVGLALGELGTTIARNPALTVSALAGTSLVTSFIKAMSGSSGVVFPPLTISLDGAMTSNLPTFNVVIPVASSRQFSDLPPLAFAERNPDRDELVLGQHNLSERPKAKVYAARRIAKYPGNYYRLYYRAWDVYLDLLDARCQLAVSPVSGAKLKDVQVMLEKLPLAPGITDYSYRNAFGSQPPTVRTLPFFDPGAVNSRHIGRFYPVGRDDAYPWDYIEREVKPARFFDTLTARVRYTLETSPGRTMDVVKSIPIDVETIIVPAPPLDNASWDKPVTALQAVLDPGLVQRNHSTCGYRDPAGQVVRRQEHFPATVSYEGRAHWYLRPSVRPDRGPVATSGYVGPGETSTMVVRFLADQYSFQWQASSEAGGDVLEWWSDAQRAPDGTHPMVKMDTISGETGVLTQAESGLETRWHTVKFVYRKNGSKVAGQDRGFLHRFAPLQTLCGGSWNAPCCAPTQDRPGGNCGPQFFCIKDPENPQDPGYCAR